MEPASNRAANIVAPASTPRKGPRYVAHKQNFRSFRPVAIAAAAIAAVTISAGVRRHRRSTKARKESSRTSSRDCPVTELRPKRRRNRNGVAATICEAAANPECAHPGCHCQFQPSAQSDNRIYGRCFQDSNSCSEGETCTYCVKTLTEHNKCKCSKIREDTAQNVPREVQHYPTCQPFGYYSQAQLPERCPTFPNNPVCCALHECCCEHQTSSNSPNGSRVKAGFLCPGVPEYRSMKTCCVQRMRHGVNASPTASSSTICRKKHVHPQATCCDCHPQWTRPQTPVRTARTLKPVKSKLKDQRVQARRIRHPACDDDSNSETELCAPVTDVRAFRSAPTHSSTSSSTGQTRPLLNPPARALPAANSSSSLPLTVESPKADFSPGTSVQAYRVMLPQREKECESTSSSSDSSRTSEIPGTVSSTSTTSDNSTDLSDTSTSSNEECRTTRLPPLYPFPYPRAAAPSDSTSQQNAVQFRNPIHTFYQNPHVNQVSIRDTPLPISSGDFWNVRRPWPGTAGEQRADGPDYAHRIARERISNSAQWAWMGQHPTANPAGQHPRNNRGGQEHGYNV